MFPEFQKLTVRWGGDGVNRMTKFCDSRHSLMGITVLGKGQAA